MDTQRRSVVSSLKGNFGYFVFGLFSDNNTEGRSFHSGTGKNEVKNHHIQSSINNPKQTHMLNTTYYGRRISTSIFQKLNYFENGFINYCCTFCKLWKNKTSH